MKKHIKAAIAVVFTVMTCLFGGMSAFAWNTDEYAIYVDYCNEPEGTAFAELLFKSPDGDKYLTGENETACSQVSISSGDGKAELSDTCGLVGFDKDGYICCLFRRSFAAEYTAEPSRTVIRLDRNKGNVNDIFNYYRSFRVAYCDEKGNVLGVTEPVEAEKCDGAADYDISADGDKLSLELHHAPNVAAGVTLLLVYVIVSILIFAAFIAMVVVLVIVLIKRSEKKKALGVRSKGNKGD